MNAVTNRSATIKRRKADDDARIPENPVYGLGGVPVDMTAANAIKGGYTHEVRLDPCDSINPIPVKPAPIGTPELIGYSFGRLKVIGRSGEKGKSRRGAWVVKCACGIYSRRTSKAIRNPSNDRDACGRCRHIAHIKAHYEWSKTGRDVRGEDFL